MGQELRFAEIDYWVDLGKRDGAAQMAVDEVILRHGLNRPLLRVYRWDEPVITTGYFEDVANAREQLNEPRIPLVRRFTGGGTVLHGSDLPYTVIVPKAVGDEVFGNDRNASYRAIHRALAVALEESGVMGISLKEHGDQMPGIPCFQSPVAADLVETDTGKKLAGAGQRRTRDGMIHQGSVDTLGLDVDLESFGKTLADLLAEHSTKVSVERFGDDFGDRWQSLRASRYGTSEWNRDGK